MGVILKHPTAFETFMNNFGMKYEFPNLIKESHGLLFSFEHFSIKDFLKYTCIGIYIPKKVRLF